MPIWRDPIVIAVLLGLGIYAALALIFMAHIDG